MRPSPAPTPRLSQPQQIRSLTCGMSENHSQIFLPVFASRAKMSSLPVGMYITPSITSGSASKRYFVPLPEPRRVIHAPFRFCTFVVLTWVNVDQRWLLSAPPKVIQSLEPDVVLASSCEDGRVVGTA